MQYLSQLLGDQLNSQNLCYLREMGKVGIEFLPWFTSLATQVYFSHSLTFQMRQ